MKKVYFDISATTPLDPSVFEYMIQVEKDGFGNGSSIHAFGQKAKAYIEIARRQLAESINAKISEIIFTSGGSESNNMVMRGILKQGDHLIISSYEHPSIAWVEKKLPQLGIEVDTIQPDKEGIVNTKDIKKKIKTNTRLISIMLANNELGSINDLQTIGKIAKEKNILVHSDAVQALGKINIDTQNLNVDLLSFSSHKLYGPKGAGALYIRSGVQIDSLIKGGGQESNLRSGTENVSGIAGFGKAVILSKRGLEINTQKNKDLEKLFYQIMNKNNIQYKKNVKNNLPGVMNITFYNTQGQILMMNLDLMGIAISHGSACSSGSVQASKILTECGFTNKEALNTVRISIGKIHSKDDIKYLCKKLIPIIEKYQKIEVPNE